MDQMNYDINSPELLQYIPDSVKMQLADVWRNCEMAKKEEVLKRNNVTISPTKDGQYTTHFYVMGSDGKKSRKQIKRKSREALVDYVFEFYKEVEDNPTINDIFYQTQTDREKYDHKEPSTISRDARAYRRYFTSFGEKHIKDVTAIDIEHFLRDTRRQLDLNTRGMDYLLQITRRILEEASVNHYISYDYEVPLRNAKTSARRSVKRIRKTDEEEVYSREEMARLEEYLRTDPSIHALGIRLMMQTGMRVGEVAALKWEDYDEINRSIHIQRTETFFTDEHGKYHVAVSDHPKTDAGNRYIPVTDAVREILQAVRVKNKTQSEYMFCYKAQRIKSEKIRKKLMRVCQYAGIPYRSPHKFRKTFATMLYVKGTPPQIIKEIMGHTRFDITENVYIKPYGELGEKADAMSQALVW